MMEAAVGALPAVGTRLVAVTILTSHDDGSLGEVGVGAAASPTPCSGWPGWPGRRGPTASWPRRSRSPWSATPAARTS